MNERKDKYRLFLLIAIVLIGALIRFYKIGAECLWLDEAISYSRGLMSVSEIIKSSYGWDVHPPTFYLIIHWIIKLGNSETLLRLFPALCAILALPLMYRYSRSVFTKWQSLLPVMLISLSVFHVWYAQEVRVYSLFFLVSLCTFIFFHQAIYHNQKRDWLLWAGFTLLNFYIHYFSLILLGAQIVCYLLVLVFEKGKNSAVFKWFLVSILIIVIGSLPQIVFFIGQAATKISISAGTFQIMNPKQFFLVFLKQIINPATLSNPLLERGIKYLVLLFLMIGMVTGWKKYKKEILFHWGIVLFSLFFSWITSLFLYFSGTFRFVIFILVPFVILFSISVLSIADRICQLIDKMMVKRKRCRFFPNCSRLGSYGVIIGLTLVFLSYLLIHYFEIQKKPDWRTGVSQILRHADKHVSIYPIPGWADYVVKYYLSRNSSEIKIEKIPDLTISDMDSLVFSSSNILFITDGHILNRNERKSIDAWLSKNTVKIWEDVHFPRSAVWQVVHNRKM